MGKKYENTFKKAVKGVSGIVRTSKRNLVQLTLGLDRCCDGLNAQELPEYKSAIEALNSYETALIKRFSQRYQR